MFNTIKNIFLNKNVRKRILYTIVILVVIRIGSVIPIPGINSLYLRNMLSEYKEVLSFFDIFTGGSFSQMSIFALSITPYITASIVVQLLGVVFKKIEEFQKEGEFGNRKINKITRYLAFGLSILESTSMTIGFGRRGMLNNFNFVSCLIVIFTMVTGSMFVIWLADRITENGIGNGVSIVLLINIISRIPVDFANLYNRFVKPTPYRSFLKVISSAFFIIVIIFITIILVILLQDSERRIYVQYAQRLSNISSFNNIQNRSYIPFKLNIANVMPIIFAHSIMQFPAMICMFLGKSSDSFFIRMLSINSWLVPGDMKYSVGLIIYLLLISFFAYFYVSIAFNPLEIADNMRKSNSVIVGIRPGKPTSDYLKNVSKYIVFMGIIGLIIVQMIPIFFNGWFNAQVSFGGTSMIIIVGIVFEIVKQIKSQIVVKEYKRFLKKR